MPTAMYRGVVVFHGSSLMPEDRYNMDFHFVNGTLASDGTNADEIVQMLENFINTTTAGTPLSAYRSPDVVGCDVVVYAHPDLNPATPTGPPVVTTTIPFDGAADPTGLPNEVAVALSFHGNLTTVPEFQGATRPRARRRGRIFFGPLSISAQQHVAPFALQPRPASALKQLLLEHADLLMNQANAALLPWVVWSRAGQSVVSVEGGWVDNAFDTQRRRGVAPTSRNVFP